ncbi:MAG: hypothetical protein JRN52_09430 [Nitrososphaerota archaeon]|nr:hypothetical protein [Nitrososphaerota archaeon]
MKYVKSVLFILLSAIGVADAAYTAYEYATANFGSCTINSYLSCGIVAASGHTSMFGIPFYVLGLVWFPALLILGVIFSRAGRSPLNAVILLPFLMIGNIFTVYLWYLELGVIGAICPSCVSLYAINYALTAIVVAEIV